jgi:DnaJ-domain-containing protein 1
MKGQLYEHPLAELIREISLAALSGALRLEHELARAVVYLEDGAVVYAVSNLRAYRLAECLRRWRVVSEEQLAVAGEHTSDMNLVYALSAAGALSRQEIGELLARQASEVLRPALLWTGGSWNFDPRVRLTEEVKGTVLMDQILMEGARRLPPEYAASRFPDRGELLSPAPGVPEHLPLQPAEAFVLSRLDAPLRVRELTAISGLPETETLRAIYTLALGGFLQRERWSRAFTDEMVTKALAIKTQAQQAATAKGATAADVRKEEKSATTTAAATPAAEEPKPERDERQELEDLFVRLSRATDFYQVLGVGRRAELSEIKRVYHSLAKRFHPDRFHQDPTVRARIEDAFAQIAQAYETLKDRRSRATYDYKLEGR